MIISMPCDRERNGSEAYSMKILAKKVQAAKEDSAAAFAPTLATWISLCYRHSGQMQLIMDVSLDSSSDDAEIFGLKLDLELAMKAQDLMNYLSEEIELQRNAQADSNCAFFALSSENARDYVRDLVKQRRYELALLVLWNNGRWHMELVYNSHLHDDTSVQELMDRYVRWLDCIQVSPETLVGRLPMFTAHETTALYQLLDSRQADYPETPLYALILERARQYPDAVAAASGSETLSYGDLVTKSQGLACRLETDGVKVGSVVGVCLPATVDLLVAILGIWQVGAIYCPLDPGHPETYVQHMLDQANPHTILLHSRLQSLPCLLARRHLILDQVIEEDLPARQVQKNVTGESGAYLFFTSGTTGKPKAVLASHRNLSHYIHGAQQLFAFHAQDAFISIARYTFSISLFDLISPLCVGAKLYLAERHDILNPERLIQLLADVTVLHAGPSLLSSLFRYLRSHPEQGQSLSRLRHVSSGGDIVSASIMEEMKRVFSHAEVYVLYGSTEVSCMGTFHEVSRQTVQTKSLVGRSFPNVKVRVLDENLELQGFGVTGEICFAGPGVTLGYYNRPDLEVNKFVMIQGERFYRMGDMGRLMRNGDLEMLGRLDYQIQLRGIRIELVGIENTIRELGLAEQCALVHRKDEAQESLIAVLVGGKEMSLSDFRRTLAQHLPDFMLPQHLVRIEKMPLTVNGKLDRRALQDLPYKEAARNDPDASGDQSLRAKLSLTFASILNRNQFEADQNFFDEGGHSLLAVILLQDIREKFNLNIPPQVFFVTPTVNGILTYLDGKPLHAVKPIHLNSTHDKTKLFMLAGVQTYRPLARRLADSFSAFAVFTPEELSATDANRETLAITRLSDYYLDQIRESQAKGPYHLLGYSFAGIVAFDVAQKLKAAGEEVGLLVLIDAIIPEWNDRWTFRFKQLRRALRTPPHVLWQFIRRRLKEKMLPKFSSFNQFRKDPKLGRLQEERIQAKSEAALSYVNRRQIYTDPCLLIVSGDRLRQDPLKSRTCGWSEVIPNLSVRTVAGDHFKMVEEEPDVSEIARLIRQFYRERFMDRPKMEPDSLSAQEVSSF